MTPLVPRPFQSLAMAAVGDKLRGGAKGVCLVSPTGSGKTVMGAWMALQLVGTGKTIAWGGHRGELIDQAARTLRAMGLTIGMNGVGRDAPVQLGTYQTWAARGSAPDADFFISDECHHMGDRVGWQRIPQGYLAAGKRIIGLTATPARADGRALPDFDALVVAAQIAELQALGLLVPLRWRGPKATLASLKVAQDPWDFYREEAMGRCAVVFASNLNAARSFAEGFAGIGIRAEVVDGAMEQTLREQTIAAHGRSIPVLISVATLTEGWDNPLCDVVITARGCGSPALLIQMVGRGLRPSPGKVECLWGDLTGLAWQHGRPDGHADYSLEGAGIVLSQAAPPGERLCRVCHAPLEDRMVCLDCRKDHSPPVPKATGEALTDWEERREVAKAALQPSRSVLSLAGILRKSDMAAKEGRIWKPGAAKFRFKMVWKRWPTDTEMASAVNFNRAAERAPMEAE